MLPPLLASLKTLMLNDDQAAAANLAQLSANFGFKSAPRTTAGYDPLGPFTHALPQPSYQGIAARCAAAFHAMAAPSPSPSRKPRGSLSHSGGRHQFRLLSGASSESESEPESIDRRRSGCDVSNK